MRVARYGATCNSLDPGGVLTPLGECVMNDPELWAEIIFVPVVIYDLTKATVERDSSTFLDVLCCRYGYGDSVFGKCLVGRA